jgi:hypothetical protein
MTYEQLQQGIKLKKEIEELKKLKTNLLLGENVRDLFDALCSCECDEAATTRLKSAIICFLEKEIEINEVSFCKI